MTDRFDYLLREYVYQCEGPGVNIHCRDRARAALKSYVENLVTAERERCANAKASRPDSAEDFMTADQARTITNKQKEAAAELRRKEEEEFRSSILTAIRATCMQGISVCRFKYNVEWLTELGYKVRTITIGDNIMWEVEW